MCYYGNYLNRKKEEEKLESGKKEEKINPNQ